MATRGLALLSRRFYSYGLSALAQPCASPGIYESPIARLSPNGAVPCAHTLIPSYLWCFPGDLALLSAPALGCSGALVLSYRDDLRREQFNRIVGKLGVRKKDAGIYWSQYKSKRIKIRKRKRYI